MAGEVDSEGNPLDFTVIPGGSVRFTTDIFDNLSEHENHSFSPAGNSNGADLTIWTLNFPNPTTLYFAQTGNGAGFTADHVFTNPLPDATVSATMNLIDDDGAPLPIDIVAAGEGQFLLSRSFAPTEILSSVDFQVPPFGAVTISSSGIGDVPVDGALEVNADNTLGGVVRFRIPGIGVAGVGESEPLSAFIIPVRRIAGGINTGVALHHTRASGQALAQTITLNLSLQDESGAEVAVTTIDDFPERGHLADFIDELFPEYFQSGGTENFSGTLIVRVQGGRAAATALELGPNPGEFTTLPVTPVP